MKLTIFAATGGIGRQLLQQVVAAGHDVTAVVRNPQSLPSTPACRALHAPRARSARDVPANGRHRELTSWRQLPGDLQPYGVSARWYTERLPVLAAELRRALVANEIADLRHVCRLGHEQRAGLLQADLQDSIRIIHRALEAGINVIDTADVYSRGESEEIVGRAIKGRRDDLVIATKFGLPMGEDPNQRGGSRRWIAREVEDSLRRLDQVTAHRKAYVVHGASAGSHDMNVSLDEHRLGGLRWIVLRGPDREAFRALGEHTHDEIAALTATWPLLGRLREHVSSPPGSDRLATVRQASSLGFPEVWAELAAFARGAAVPFEDLTLLNFRGDIGQVAGGIGCSDLAWRRERSVIAHNEDGAPENVGQCALLTLALDGLPTVRPRPGALLSWKSGRDRVRCCGTPITDGTCRVPSHRRGAIAWRAVRRWAPSPSPRKIPTRPGSCTSWRARRYRTASAAIPRPATRPPRCARSSRTSPQVRPSSPPGTTSR